jgi:hypothetical protein
MPLFPITGVEKQVMYEVAVDLLPSSSPVSEDILFPNSGRHSSVSVVTRYRLDCLGIESQSKTRLSVPLLTPPLQQVPGLSKG